MRKLISINIKWSSAQSTLLNLIFIQKIKIQVRCRLMQTAANSPEMFYDQSIPRYQNKKLKSSCVS